jgi:tetratricopeptide (TPR) repeat protein
MLLDNLESVMDGAAERLTEPALQEALTVLLTAPAHAVTLIVTTRLTPTGLLGVEPGVQRQLQLDKGLGPEDADTVLRELDEDGTLGLRDAADELLKGLCAHTRGFPRALEVVKAILDGDRTLTPRDLLNRTHNLPEDRVVEVLVGEAYRQLDQPAQQVMQALAVFPSPVSVVGVDFLLRPFDPTTNAAPILARLVRRQLVRFHDEHYYLHPIDRDYALDQIPPGAPGDPTTAFTLAGLRALAADYYTQIRTPRESWRSLDDIQPQLAEFELRCATGDYDTAATVLADIDYDYMRPWGHHRTLVQLHLQIEGRISDPLLNAGHLNILGLSHSSLGDYQRAIELHSQSLTIAWEIGNRDLESADLTNLGNCHNGLGDYRRAIELYTQSLTIAREIGNPDLESADLTNLGNCHNGLGDYQRAIELYTQSLTIAREIGNPDLESADLTNLGLCHYCLGDYRQAINLHNQSLVIAREIGNRDRESNTLANLGLCHSRLGDYQQAIDMHNQSLAIAREIGNRYLEAWAMDCLGRALLAVGGDTGQALSLFNQAVAIADSTGDIEPAVEARSGLARTHLLMDDPGAALAVADAALQRPYPTEQPTLLLLKAIALLQLGRTTDGVQAFEAASRAVEALLELHDRNVAALYTQALALCGLAVASGDPDKAGSAADAYTRLRTVTTAAGVIRANLQLLDQIRRNDQTGLLTDLRAAQSL